MWEGLFYIIFSIVLSYAMRPKAQTPKPEAFEDLDIPQIAEGTAQSVVFGDAWIKDWQVLNVGFYGTIPISKGGGK